jgi:hypothetical protein
MKPELLGGLKALPLLQEAVWTLKYYARGSVTPFNGRWDRLRALLEDLDRAPPAPSAPAPRRVLVFAGNEYWVNYLLPVAVALAGRNCLIDFLWWPRDYEPFARGGERFKKWSARFAPPEHDCFRLINLLDFAPAAPAPELVEQAEAIARFDTCYFNARETVAPENCPEDREVFEFRRARNLEFLCRMKTFLAGGRYDSALTANAAMCELGAFYRCCQRVELPCVSLDSFEADDSIVAAQDWPCHDWRTEEIWQADHPHRLTPERERRVLERIAFRDNPQQQTDRWHQLQTVTSISPDQLREALRLDRGRPLAVLCTNVAWDSAVIGRGRAFPSMKEWYLEVIRWFAARPGWQLVVRTHPVEAKLRQPMSVSDFITEAFPALPPNVRLVRPTDKINTYGLMKLTDLGLAFTSTVGLEMAIRGLPVILAGNVHYAGKGFTFEPADRAEYFALLESATGPDRLALTPRQIELARCYFDAYFEKFPKKMPWRWSQLDEDLTKWPVSRIAAGDCPGEFLKTFDYLAGRKVEGLF